MDGDGSSNVTARLDAALSALEAAVARVAGAEQVRADLSETLAIMDDDRQRLASDLDAALARGRALEAANDSVAARLQKLDERLVQTGATVPDDAGP